MYLLEGLTNVIVKRHKVAPAQEIIALQKVCG